MLKKYLMFSLKWTIYTTRIGPRYLYSHNMPVVDREDFGLESVGGWLAGIAQGLNARKQ